MKQPVELNNLFCLSSSVKLYVPSTKNVDSILDESEHAVEVDKALSALGTWFGGATAFKALGSWVSADKGLVKESVTIVVSYCSENDLLQRAAEFIAYAEQLKARLGQEAVSVEINNQLYFV